MRVLLTSNASYVPPRGGSTRGNLAWLEQIARAGHSCDIVCALAERDTPERRMRLARELEEQRFPANPERFDNGVELRRYGSISVHSVEEPARRPALLAQAIRRFEPDWVLVSSEDLSHALLREAERSAPGRVVYLAHTPQFFPFGPESWSPDPNATASVRRATAIVAIGRHMAAYIEKHTGSAATVIHPPIYGQGPFPSHGSFGTGLITLVNPCAVKGISIFLELASAFPRQSFGVLPGWGTTQDDLSALSSLPNVEVLPHARSIDEVFAKTKVLIAPSLWYEGFGLIVMEAMLRGVPVIASDSGGLVEAKRGTGFVIPVRAVESYEPVFDDRHMPKPVIPPQDLAPWREALETLVSNRSVYESEREVSRRFALDFVEKISRNGLGEFLTTLPRPATPQDTSPWHEDHGARLAKLSPEKRALLLERLKKVKQPER